MKGSNDNRNHSAARGRQIDHYRERLPVPMARPVHEPGRPSGALRIGGYAIVGLLVLALFFGGLIGWSVLAPLSRAALASGQVALDTKRKQVQHLEGGIVKAIRVREGQRVRAGDLLLELDDTAVREDINRLTTRIALARDQLVLIEEELASVQRLYKGGYARKPRLLALKRKRLELKSQRQEDEALLRARRDVLGRLSVTAPIAGTVVGLKVHSPRGVIKAGDELMSIVPEGETLVIEAKIDPNDIDVVRKGLEARVRLTPYSARLLAPLPGKVALVSADRMHDEATRQSYYLARITLDDDAETKAHTAKLYPGMPVEVSIVTGARTLLGYLLDPLIVSLQRGFKEE